MTVFAFSAPLPSFRQQRLKNLLALALCLLFRVYTKFKSHLGRRPNRRRKMTTVRRYKSTSGTHELTIVGYSLSKFFGDKHVLKSERFMVGDRSWSINFYPLGYSKDNAAGNIAIHLELVHGKGDVKVNFDMTLLDQTGNVEKTHFTKTENNQDVSPEKSICGWGDFMKILGFGIIELLER